jgi:hypothetical protein
MTKARDLASAAPAPSTVSATEIGYLDGVSSAIQTQIDGKSGTSHNHNSDYIAKTLTTTTGDIIYASSANTPARLGIGSTGNVLTVSGGVPAWSAPAASGSMTLLSTTTVSASSTITLSSISQDYIHLQVILDNPTVSAQNAIRFRFNSDTNTRYRNLADPLDLNNTFNSDFMRASGTIGTSGAVSCSIIDIPSYTNTYSYKYSQYCYFGKEATTTNAQIEGFANIYNQTDAITSLTFFVPTGTFSGTIRLYGVK